MTVPILLPATGDVAVVVDALRARVRAVLPETGPDDVDGVGVEVYDGPDPTRAFAPRAVTVAAAFEDEQNAVTVERAESGLGRSVTESIDVACSVYVGTGELDVDAHRATAAGILQAIDDGLRDDPTLGDTVATCRISSAQWLQGRDEQGAGVIVGFVVSAVRLP